MIINELAKRYPQLYLSPAAGMSKSDLYIEIVRKGNRPERLKRLMESAPAGFEGSAKDRCFIENTPAGNIEIVYFYNRFDFEQFLQVIMYYCEPVVVPKTIGAALISGIINWSKIEQHKKDFLENGRNPFLWNDEFIKFTSVKSNYRDDIIVISHGGYSGISAHEVNYSELEWNEISLKIRIYHECTHFICRKMHSEKIDPLWDEILADCIGSLYALNYYDTALAKRFLGLSETGFIKGGRLINYCEDLSSLDENAIYAGTIIDRLQTEVFNYQKQNFNYYDILDHLENRKEELYRCDMDH